MMNTSYLISIAYFGFNDTMNTLIQTAYDLIESFDSEVGEQNGSYWRVATKLYGSVYIEGWQIHFVWFVYFQIVVYVGALETALYKTPHKKEAYFD